MRLRSEFLSSATFREEDIPLPPFKADVVVKDKTFHSMKAGFRFADKQVKRNRKKAAQFITGE